MQPVNKISQIEMRLKKKISNSDDPTDMKKLLDQYIPIIENKLKTSNVEEQRLILTNELIDCLKKKLTVANSQEKKKIYGQIKDVLLTTITARRLL